MITIGLLMVQGKKPKPQFIDILWRGPLKGIDDVDIVEDRSPRQFFLFWFLIEELKLSIHNNYNNSKHMPSYFNYKTRNTSYNPRSKNPFPLSIQN